jgi:hypothetical protein
MRRLLVACSALLAAALVSGTAARAQRDTSVPAALERFLATVEDGPSSYRAFRRLEARNGHLSDAAWMNVWTTADESGFAYEIVGQGGSGYVRNRVFVPALEAERTMWGAGARGALTHENYTFEDLGTDPGGLAWIGLRPRRKDVLLVNGSIFLRPDDGDLVRVEGALSRAPSFWTRKVEIVRRYDRIAGVRLPVAFESVASIRLAGKATLTMSYEYHTVNGLDVSGGQTPTEAASVSR